MKVAYRPDQLELLGEVRLLNKRQLKQLIPVSDMTIWRWERDGKLPKRLSIGGRTFWRATEVMAALNHLTK